MLFRSKLSLKQIKEMALDAEVFEQFLKNIFGAEYHVSLAKGKKSEFCNGFYLNGVLKQFGARKKKKGKGADG